MTFPSGTPTKLVNLTCKSAAEGKRVNGSVRLMPNVPVIAIDGSPIRWTGGGVYRFDSQGHLMSSGGTTIGVELLDNSAPGSNPIGWLWQAFITIDGKTQVGNFSLEGVSSGVDLNDLLEVNPATPKYVAIPGIQGERGIQGIQGLKGDPGIQGLQGIQGIQGEQGLQGIQGESGSSSSGDRTAKVKITDDDLSGLPEALSWLVVRTSSNTPLQCSINAVPGDRIEAFAAFIYLGSRYLDWVLLNNSGGISVYSTTDTSSPPVEGNPGMYPALSLSRHPMPPLFVVAENHIDVTGKVTVALAHQGSGTGPSNRIYAHTSYPFIMRLKNIGPEPA